MRPLRRPRWTLFAMMLLIAAVAVALTVQRYQRVKVERERLAAEIRAAEERLAWSERMLTLGYVSRAQVEADRKQLEGARAQRRALRAW